MVPSSPPEENALQRLLSPDEAIAAWSRVIDQLAPEYAPLATRLGLHRRLLIIRRPWELTLVLRDSTGLFTRGVIALEDDGSWRWISQPLGPALAELIRGMSRNDLVLKTRREFVKRLTKA